MTDDKSYQRMARAIAPLRLALQRACDAGISHETLCANAGARWGGFFSWHHTPTPILNPDAQERIAELEKLLKEAEEREAECRRVLLILGATND